MPNRLKALQEYGQSVWLDYIRRSLITSGELHRLLDEDGLRGVTSNPTIFEKAIGGSTDYQSELLALEPQDLDPKAVYETLAIHDIRAAADILKPVYTETKRKDGYASLEVSPELAHDTQGTINEARRLWNVVARENMMIKVPATEAGLPAIRQLLSEGINVNVTLLFAQEVYERVAQAYISGLETFAGAGGDVARVASVASFFVSRIDVLVDHLIADRLKTSRSAREQTLLRRLTGKVAIANAKVAYQRYKEIYRGPRWQGLAAQGAQPQRLLWASTSTKNPSYRDVIYVEELIGPETINTIPPATFDAFRDHGQPRPSLEGEVEEAQNTMAGLAEADISMKDVTDRLLEDGVKLFSEAFDKLLGAVRKRCRAPRETVDRQTWRLPPDLDAAVRATLKEWAERGMVRKLWARDATLWTGADEGKWLGWLSITDDQMAHIDHLRRVADDARQADFTHALLLGMGGSSLCPEVLRMSFGKMTGFPELLVLDSTDPAQVLVFERKVDLAKTLFIVSSKSGTTIEPNIFKQYFFDRVKRAVGPARAGSRFIAITDPGSKLQEVAERDRFRQIFFGMPSIGGRYSALSDFGMVPAAVMGLDIARFLARAEEMAHACAACVSIEENPGAVLGIILGVLAKRGRDKVTLVASPGISGLGAWLEQLVAESTGKGGKGLIPVDREPLGHPSTYGQDRLFVYLRLESAAAPAQDEAIALLEEVGQPVVRIRIDEPYDLGAEFFRWEFATAVAGSLIAINPFDQPDVEASKVATRNLTTEYEQTGAFPPETPIVEVDGLRLFTDERNAAELGAMGRKKTVLQILKSHLSRVRPGDYVALLAYIEMNQAYDAEFQAIRRRIRDRYKVATCLGFGPRFLHSTGQAYKGGPNSGVFLQITCDDREDLPVPGQQYTFGVVKAAQARGDFQVLAERGRRALRVHLGKDVPAGLARLRQAVDQALG